MNIVKKFLLISSGADLEVLERPECRIEHNRYVGIGATIFLTAVLASFSGGYALFTVFKSTYISILFGLFWGLVIFNLDRYIVSSMRKKRINLNLPFRTQVRLKLNELVIALPRLLLAFFIAVVITRPLELRLFEAEIEAQLARNISSEIVEVQSRINLEFSEVDELNAQIGRMRQEIEDKERRREVLYQLYLDEMRGSQGSRTTGRAGRGVLAQERRRDYEQADAELQNLKRNNGEQINSINQRLSLLKNQKDARVETSVRSIQQSTGLLPRMVAFNQLTTMSPTVAWTSYFLISLFILLETAPIIVKLLSDRGPYDDIYDNLQSITYSKKPNTAVGVHDNHNGKHTHQSEDAKEKSAKSRDESEEAPIINATLLLRRDPYRLVGGTFAGKYRLEHYAGGGGMGAVYYCLPTDSENPVALKILKPDILDRNPTYAALFEREVKAAQHLEHPHIVKVLDNGIADDVLFMVMEWLNGETLDKLLSHGPLLPLDRIVNIAAQICDAVAYAHRNHTIHLDIKPGNIFMLDSSDQEDYVKVIDFGMARILSSETGTTVTRFLGTYQYCSPEHFGGKVSFRSDIYSLAATFYHMIAGVIPFGASYVNAKAHPQLELPPVPSLLNMRPDLPKGIDAVIQKALSKNPSGRQESVAQLFDEFSKACHKAD